MRRMIAAAVALLAVAAIAMVAYQAGLRQRDYRISVLRGDAALASDQTFAAIEAYSGAIALRPESMLGYLRRGETYRRRADRGDLEAAARDFRKAAELDPSVITPLEQLGDVSYQLQQYDRAIDAYERAIRLDDRSARMNYKLALARFRSGDINRAISDLHQTLRLDDRLADAHYLLGLCLRAKHQSAEALRALEKAILASPTLIPAREELAALYGVLDRRKEQLEQLQMLAMLDRQHVQRHIAVGLAQARARRWDAAVMTLRSALESHGDDPSLYRALGQVWLDSAQVPGDRIEVSKAREALDRAASSPDATSETLMLAGRAALVDGDDDTAERLLQQATERFPIDPEALLLYANVAEGRSHADAARRAIIEYVTLVEDDSTFVANAARIAGLSFRAGDAETAAHWIKRGLDRDPQNAQLAALAKRIEKQP